MSNIEKKEALIEKLMGLKSDLKQKYFVAKIGVFGSFARDEATVDSDIDLLVQFSKPVGFEFCALKLFLEEQMNRPVDLVTIKALRPQLTKDVLSEVIYL
ncbi:MAG: nucleotidyltransferase family protein [Candidatus Margulisiibacteriota bacterium]|jgi:hypothetical protein